MDNRYSTVCSFLLALIFLCVPGLLTLSAHAQDITVTVPEVEPNVGETVTLSIEADLGGKEVDSYSNMEFTFDSSVINIVEVRDGTELSFGQNNFTINEEEDTLNVSNIADNPPVSGSGEFLRIDVELTQEAGIPFELSPSEDPVGEPATSLFTSDAEGKLPIDSINQGSVGQLADAQLIHNAADPALETVDVSLNGEQAVDNFSFRSATPFVEVPAAEGVDVLVTPGGSDDTLAIRTVTFNSD
ncbi:MAG: hypothetical protein BRD25_04020, partial [Bacteroidetes bacterium QH_1_61_8]